MNLPEVTRQASPWVRESGPHGDVVLSSRVRLARNVAGFPFTNRASDVQRQELLNACRESIFQSPLAERLIWVDLLESSKQDRQILYERHLISRQHSHGQVPRGVVLATDESFAIMINEEDHLRIQVIKAGLQLDDVYAKADQIDDLLESRLEPAYSAKLGYLTACPTNVGTGIRVSVMLHLPGLKITGEIEKVRRAARELNLAIRGFYGEGTEAVGDFFQISNQTTLGRTEREILRDFQEGVIPQIIEYEHNARHALAERRSTLLEDRLQRAYGLLTHARLLSSEEAACLLSYLRLGVGMGCIPGVELTTINELFVLIQPAHLQRIAREKFTGDERREFRARFVRERLSGPPSN